VVIVHSINNEAPCNTRWFNYRASPAFLIVRSLVECFRNRYAISAHLMGIATFSQLRIGLGGGLGA